MIFSAGLSQADLVSYWPLDETEGEIAIDKIGNNDAAWQNAGLNLAWTPGKIGGAADLSDDGGGDNYFQLTIPELIGATGLSFSAWINNDANGGYNGIFMTRTFNGQSNNSWGLAIENAPNERFDARVDGPGIDSADGSLVVDGNWKHLALVWDSSTETFTSYVNGVEAASGTTTTDANFGGPAVAGPESGPWFIGYDDCCGGNRDFDGKIDEVAVWDRALTLTEIGLLAGGARPDELDSSDSDGDGMPDEYEDMFDFLDKNEDADAELDQDTDGLNNLEEYRRQTDPEDDDTDDDSLSDGAEVNDHGTNPKSADTDNDGIDDGEELVAGADTYITDPLLADTDMDGHSDGDEVANSTDPTDPNDPPAAAPMLIGHWPMDDEEGLIATDLVNGNHGSWGNADGSNLEWTQGQIGGAANLSDLGADDFFRIETINQLISSNALTIALWIEPDENTGYNGIFMTRTLDGQTNNSWGIAHQNDAGGTNHLDTRVDKAGIDSLDESLPPDGGWFHVAMVWNGVTGDHSQYINGIQTATVGGSLMRQIQSTSGPWFIGYDDCCGGGRDFDGLIDDVGMWNQALSGEEILKIYEDGLSGIGIGGPGTAFKITEITLNADDSVSLTWTSDPRDGITYSVLFSDDMSAPISTWADADDGVETGGETTTYTTSPGFATGVDRRFFAIRRN